MKEKIRKDVLFRMLAMQILRSESAPLSSLAISAPLLRKKPSYLQVERLKQTGEYDV